LNIYIYSDSFMQVLKDHLSFTPLVQLPTLIADLFTLDTSVFSILIFHGTIPTGGSASFVA
jgi:hypothetical protein